MGTGLLRKPNGSVGWQTDSEHLHSQSKKPHQNVLSEVANPQNILYLQLLSRLAGISYIYFLMINYFNTS